MKQDLKLSEKLFCLAVDPKSGGILMGAHSVLGITLSGAVLTELFEKGMISINNEVVHLDNPSYLNDEIHELFMNRIRLSKKDRRIRGWISIFNGRGGKFKNALIRQLVRKNVLRLEERRFLFIPYKKVFLMDRMLVESIGQEVKDTLMGKTHPGEEAMMLAMLAVRANLLRRIIPEKEERKTAALNLKKIPETPVTKAVKEVIQMAHAGVITMYM